MTRQEIFNKLIIIAANGISANSYRGEGVVLQTFCKLPLGDLVDLWTGLSDQTKIIVINNHQYELISWIKAQRAGTND